ncbi:hypothetical protein BLAT2472_10398 [Burkholderia latens]
MVAVGLGYATIGAVTGGDMDAAGQYAQSGTIRPAESVFAGSTGAVSGPIGANVGFVNKILLGVVGRVNTAFNNATTENKTAFRILVPWVQFARLVVILSEWPQLWACLKL